MMEMVRRIVHTGLDSLERYDPGGGTKIISENDCFNVLEQAEIQSLEQSRQEHEWLVFLMNVADESPPDPNPGIDAYDNPSSQSKEQLENLRFESTKNILDDGVSRTAVEKLGHSEFEGTKIEPGTESGKEDSHAGMTEWDELLARLSRMETALVYEILGRIESDVLQGMLQYLHLRKQLQMSDINDKSKSTFLCPQKKNGFADSKVQIMLGPKEKHVVEPEDNNSLENENFPSPILKDTHSVVVEQKKDLESGKGIDILDDSSSENVDQDDASCIEIPISRIPDISVTKLALPSSISLAPGVEWNHLFPHNKRPMQMNMANDGEKVSILSSTSELQLFTSSEERRHCQKEDQSDENEGLAPRHAHENGYNIDPRRLSSSNLEPKHNSSSQMPRPWQHCHAQFWEQYLPQVLRNPIEMFTGFGILIKEETSRSYSQSEITFPKLNENRPSHRFLNTVPDWKSNQNFRDECCQGTTEIPEVQLNFHSRCSQKSVSNSRSQTRLKVSCSSSKTTINREAETAENIEIIHTLKEAPKCERKSDKRTDSSLGDIPGQIAYTLLTKIPQDMDCHSLFLLFQQIDSILLQVLPQPAETSFNSCQSQHNLPGSSTFEQMDSRISPARSIDVHPHPTKWTSLQPQGEMSPSLPSQQMNLLIEELQIQSPYHLGYPNITRQSQVFYPPLVTVDVGDIDYKESQFILPQDSVVDTNYDVLTSGVREFYPSSLNGRNEFRASDVTVEAAQPAFFHNMTENQSLNVMAAMLNNQFDFSAVTSDPFLLHGLAISRGLPYADMMILDEPAPPSTRDVLDDDSWTWDEHDHAPYMEDDLGSGFGDTLSVPSTGATSSPDSTRSFRGKTYQTGALKPLAQNCSNRVRKRPLVPELDLRGAGLVWDESQTQAEIFAESDSDKTEISDGMQRPHLRDFTEIGTSDRFREPQEMSSVEPGVSEKLHSLKLEDFITLGRVCQASAKMPCAPRDDDLYSAQRQKRTAALSKHCSACPEQQQQQPSPKAVTSEKHFADGVQQDKGQTLDTSESCHSHDTSRSGQSLTQSQFQDPSTSVKRTTLGLLILAGVLYLGENRDQIERHSVSASEAAAAAWRWLGKFLAKMSKGELEK